jgi:hypothetical protein
MRPFQAVFMAFFNMIVRENKKIVDKNKLYKTLEGAGDDILHKSVIDELYSCNKIKQVTASIQGRIENCLRIIQPLTLLWMIGQGNVQIY